MGDRSAMIEFSSTKNAANKVRIVSRFIAPALAEASKRAS
jgi:hypothetical protein